MILSIDTETTGLDLRHAARPFYVSTCTDAGVQRSWAWPVDPFTRAVTPDPADLHEVRELARAADRVVMHNAKFDVTALGSVGCWDGFDLDEHLWPKLEETVVAAHCLASDQPKSLDALAVVWLGVDIGKYEDRLRDAVQDCRRLCRRNDFKGEHGEWAIAREDTPGLPSAKKDPWRCDYWLPAAVADAQGLPANHPYRTALSEYADADPEVTVALWGVLSDELRRRGLWTIYRSRVELVRAAYEMEKGGVHLSATRLRHLSVKYAAQSTSLGQRLRRQAAGDGYALELPAGASPNGSLRGYCFGPLALPRYHSAKAKTPEPSLDKEVMARYLKELPPGPQLTFVETMVRKRARDMALGYAASYRDFWLPCDGDTRVMYPSINPTGTRVTRMSSSGPNEQQISRREEDCLTCGNDKDKKIDCPGCDGRGSYQSLRYVFGPAPGREWWSLDFENIELRLPAYDSGEGSMVELFERPDDPPFFGSYHLLNASVVYPDLFWPLADKKGAFKAKYEATWYKWCKNGGFAIQYGCQEAKADLTFKRPGAFKAIKEKLPKVAALSDHFVRFADKYGYVETMPDRTVDPTRGYRVTVSRADWGGVSPTTPFSYRVQGTAGWCGNKALVRCTNQLDDWRRGDGFDGRVVLYVHDELVFDLPALGRRNLPKVRRLAQLMRQSGDDVGVPLKVSASYHPDNWGESVPH